MERKKLLQSSTEQERLLGNLPRVIPEAVQDIVDEEKGQEGSPKSTLISVPSDKWEGSTNSSVEGVSLLHKERQHSLSDDDKNMTWSSHEEQLEQFRQKTLPSEADLSTCTAAEEQDLRMDVAEARPKGQAAVTAELNKFIGDNDDDRTSNVTFDMKKPEDPESSVWHISGTGGDKTVKYSLSLLKKWSETCPYGLRLKVWKENESEDSAIWLSDAINLAFPRS